MAAETLSNQQQKENEHTRASIETFAKHRESSIATSKLLKTLGFLGSVAGAGLLLAAHAFATPVALLADSVLAKMWAAGKVALGVGGGLLGIGLIKEPINKRERPA